MNLFKHVQGFRPKKNKFDLSYERKASMNMGLLYPIMVQDVVPSDKFRCNSEILMRLAPMLAPVMHRIDVYTHFFFVPNRLIWNEWESFITGGRDGTEAPILPHIPIQESTKNHFAKGGLSDHLGLPVIEQTDTVANAQIISALPYRAYQTIFNEYYQDQNLTEPISIDLGSGNMDHIAGEVGRLASIRGRAWEKDYFTSALPWAQRGGEVSMPTEINYSDRSTAYDTNDNPINGGDWTSDSVGQLNVGATNARVENIDDIGVTINDLRKATRLQEWLEKTARGGSRYIEQIMSHFGKKSSDARLQRPEFLGGGKSPVNISEVLSTVGEQTPSTFNPQGTMSGHGIAVGAGNGFKKEFEEHGYIIGIMSILPRTAYQQGVERHWLKTDKTEFYWPSFAQLGEQEVYDIEAYYDYKQSDGNLGTFGYQSRYAEYKYKQSSVHGDFRDDLSFWHQGRIFSSKPNLNEAFVTSDPSHRIFAVTDPTEDKLYCQIYNRVDALRPMPYFNNPTL